MTTRITIRKWLAAKNNLPRIVDVEVIERTQKAIHVKGSAAVEGSVFCWNCNRELTHAISQQLGIGPICCDHLGIDWNADTSPEAIAALKARLVTDTEFETWLPISQIEAEDDLDQAPRKAQTEREKPEGVGSLEQAEGRMATIEITPWIAEQKGFLAPPSTKDRPENYRYRGKIKKATPKAICLLVQYSWLVLGDDLDQIEFWTEEARTDDKLKVEGDVVRITHPKRKSNEYWFPVSQITNVEIDEPRKVPVRKAIKHEKVEPTEHVPTEYEKQCEAALKALGV